MLKIFFDISTGFKFSKISVECSVHLCSCPWAIELMPIYYRFDLILLVVLLKLESDNENLRQAEMFK